MIFSFSFKLCRIFIFSPPWWKHQHLFQIGNLLEFASMMWQKLQYPRIPPQKKRRPFQTFSNPINFFKSFPNRINSDISFRKKCNYIKRATDPKCWKRFRPENPGSSWLLSIESADSVPQDMFMNDWMNARIVRKNKL